MSVRWVGRLLAYQSGWHRLGHTCRSNSLGRVVLDGVELYN